MTVNACPECLKQYAEKPIRCACGWYLVEERKLKKSLCHYMEKAQQCNEYGSVAISPRESVWYCSKHAELERAKRYDRILGSLYE